MSPGLRKPRVKRKRTKGREGLAAEPAITRSGVSVASDFIAPCELSELEPLSQSTQEDDGRGFNFTLPNPDMSDVEEDDDVIIVEGEHFDRVLRNETRGHQCAHRRKRDFNCSPRNGRRQLFVR